MIATCTIRVVKKTNPAIFAEKPLRLLIVLFFSPDVENSRIREVSIHAFLSPDAGWSCAVVVWLRLCFTVLVSAYVIDYFLILGDFYMRR